MSAAGKKSQSCFRGGLERAAFGDGMRMNNLRIILKRLIKSTLLTVLLLLLPLLQYGCYKPVAAHSLSAKESTTHSALNSASIDESSQFVDSQTEYSIKRFGPIIQKYSEKYDMDWRLVLSVMKRESRFRPKALSYRGAFGLMQIMPTTQNELAGKLGLDEAESPYNNIRAGIYHLRSLYRVFEGADHQNRIRLTLAAYNAGLSRILDARDIARFLGDDPNDWRAVKAALPLLSKRHYTLHEKVWEGGKPRAGFFRDWVQTQNYVESIIGYYDEYQLALR